MKFPEIQKLGTVLIEDRRYVVFLMNEEYEGPDDGHDSEHARGQCECPCSPLNYALERAIEDESAGLAQRESTDAKDGLTSPTPESEIPVGLREPAPHVPKLANP